MSAYNCSIPFLVASTLAIWYSETTSNPLQKRLQTPEIWSCGAKRIFSLSKKLVSSRCLISHSYLLKVYHSMQVRTSAAREAR
jgi:hypothetical protein